MDNIMDPELTSEVVKLLGQELKTRPTSVSPFMGSPFNVLTHESAQALTSENDALKADNVALQERIVRLQSELSQSMFPTREEFTMLVAENQDLIREKEEASRNQEKLRILHEKYQRMKTRVHEYNEAQLLTLPQIMNELRDTLSNCTQELEQTRKTVVTEIDFRDFLNNTPYEPVEGQLGLSSIPLHDGGVHAKLREVEVPHQIDKGLYRLGFNEVIWSPSGIAFGLVIKPAFQYNPKRRGGSWTKVEDGFGEQMDICYLSGKSFKTSRYLGTYERVPEQGIMTITPETLQYLDHEKLVYASRRTTLHQELVPPSQTDMIKNMYKQGVIKLQCFGIRCVAINQTLVQKLQDMNAFSASSDLPVRAIIPTPGDSNRDTRKRKRDSNSTVQSRRKKKKGPPSKA
ncbi:hypothetical protein JVU11DRAFT_5301 [Chiua virens]|nr:hypothetical protein JVU11DRAFT_5301 [Chiua virens]